MPQTKILVVDDESDILELVRVNLAKEGYEVLCSQTGNQAIELAKRHNPDLLILDLMLPGMDGLEVCRQIRRDPRLQHVQIMMLTAKDQDVDIVTGLEVGADDYVTKPFSIKVLVARVRNLLRRRQVLETDQRPIKTGKMVIDPARREVTIDGKSVDLTYTEFNILLVLASRPGLVLTRYQIMDAAHGQDYIATDRAVDVQIVSLRRKLGRYGHHIQTVRGVGYRFSEKP